MIANPLLSELINGPNMDKLTVFHDGTIDYVLMKCASVIGDIFDIQMLNRINPL